MEPLKLSHRAISRDHALSRAVARRFEKQRKTFIRSYTSCLIINRIDACLEANALETFVTFWCLNQYCPQETSSLFSIRRLQDLSRWKNTRVGLIRVVMEKSFLKLRSTESMNEGCSKLVRNRRAIAMKRFRVSTLRFCLFVFFFFLLRMSFLILIRNRCPLLCKFLIY